MKSPLLAALTAAAIAAFTVQMAYLGHLDSVAEKVPRTSFDDVNIVFIMGGAPNQHIFEQVYQGIAAAQQDLRCRVDVRWTDWREDRILEVLQNAIRRRPSGICLIGFPAQDDFAPLIRNAFRRGIIVTGLNVPIPEMEAAHGPQGFGYAGQNTLNAGRRLGDAVAPYFGLVPGDRVLLMGAFSHLGRSLRPKACFQRLQRNGLLVDYIDLDAVRALPSPADSGQLLIDYLDLHPDAKLCITDATSILSLAKALQGEDHPPGTIALAGFDVDEASREAMALGYGSLLLDQQPFLQGYLPVLQICLARRFGAAGLRFETDGKLIAMDGETPGQ